MIQKRIIDKIIDTYMDNPDSVLTFSDIYSVVYAVRYDYMDGTTKASRTVRSHIDYLVKKNILIKKRDSAKWGNTYVYVLDNHAPSKMDDFKNNLKQDTTQVNMKAKRMFQNSYKDLVADLSLELEEL